MGSVLYTSDRIQVIHHDVLLRKAVCHCQRLSNRRERRVELEAFLTADVFVCLLLCSPS